MLHAFDVYGEGKGLKWNPADQAAETLGVFVAVNRDTSTKAIQKKSERMDGINEGWMTVTWRNMNGTELHHSVNFDLPITCSNMFKKQHEQMMSILLQYALPTMGVCRSFPRQLIFTT